MATTRDVKLGFWTDYARSPFNRFLYLCKDSTATIWTNAMAILITLTMARLVQVILEKSHTRWPTQAVAASSSQPIPLQTSTPAQATTSIPATAHLPHSRTREFFEETHSSFGGFLRGIDWMMRIVNNRPPTLTSNNQSRSLGAQLLNTLKRLGTNIVDNVFEISLLAILALICLLLFAVESGLGIFSSQIITSDGLALSNSKDCGIYHLPANVYYYQSNASTNIDASTEMASATYANDCYDSENRQDGCNYFYKQSIPYYEVLGRGCPFGDDVCPENFSEAYTLSTGIFSAIYLGLNARTLYTVNRTISCTPLNMNSSFVRQEMNNNTSPPTTEYRYYYGSSQPDPFTWSNPIQPTFSFAQRAFYNAFVWTAYNNLTFHSWEPHPALAPPTGHSTVLWLIGSNRVFHRTPRTDPIFPTTTNSFLSIGNMTFPIYFDATNQARALACSEEILLCVPNGTYCQPISTGMPPSPRWPSDTWPDGIGTVTALYLTMHALKDSEIGTSIRTRLGYGLIASSKISQAMSLSLPEEQWKVEVRSMFETALARSQIHVRDIARGTNANQPGFINELSKTTDRADEVLCRQYKFYAVGYKNLNVWGLVSVLLGLGLILVGSSSPVLAFFERPSVVRFFRPIKHLLWNILRAIIFVLRQLWRWINLPLVWERLWEAVRKIPGAMRRGADLGIQAKAWLGRWWRRMFS